MKSPKLFGWGVVGMGLQGQRLVRAIRANGASRLAATASERAPGSFVRALANASVDAVAITSPNFRHSAHVVAAARAGKHILCEKPLALSMQEAAAMQRAIAKSNVKCFVNYHLRMHPDVERARKLIAKNALGRITFIEMQWSIGALATELPRLPRHMQWREDPKQSGGGALVARGVHLFDLARYITGKDVAEVRGWSDAATRAVDRTMTAILLLKDNVPVTVTSSKAMPHAYNHIVIYGTRGRLELRDLFSDKPENMYAQVVDAFVQAMRGKRTPLATVEDGVWCVRLAEAFRKAAATGKAARLR